MITASTVAIMVILLKYPGEGTTSLIVSYFARQYSPATDYCNFMDVGKTTDEGNVIGDAELVSMTVVLRHGDRFHMGDSRVGDIESPRVSCKLSTEGETDKRISTYINLMNQMIGSMPTSSRVGGWRFPPYPNSSLCAPELLSPAGVRQHLKNGEELRQAYAAKLNLSSVGAKSTDYARTYQSALAFLHGLNPQLSWSQLEIERVSSTRFCSARAVGNCACMRLDALARSARAAVKFAWEREDSAYSQFVAHASRLLASNVAAPYPWESAFDFLSQFTCRKLQLPCNNGSCFLEGHVNLLWRHLQYYSRKLALNSDFESKCRIEMHPLLTEIASRFNSFVGKNWLEAAPPQVLVYSGHDVTVTPLLIALGVPLGSWPPYASRLVFEQLRDTKRSRHYIRVLFNGADVTRKLRFCRKQDSGPCPLEDFSAFVESGNLGELGYRSYYAACRVG